MKTYAIVNRKGGVGKTTTAVELAYEFAVICRERVLLIDADSQGNASSLLASAAEAHGSSGLGGVLAYDLDTYQDAIVRTDFDGLDLCPATEELADYELACTIGAQGPHFDRLPAMLEALTSEYDRVIIDCPPYYSVACIAALSACTSIIIPAGIDAYSTTGMTDLCRQIDSIRKACPAVSVAGVLVTQYHRCDVAEDALQILRAQSPVPIFGTVIRRTDKAVESSWAGQPVGEWSPFSAAARDYRAFAAELLRKEAGIHD